MRVFRKLQEILYVVGTQIFQIDLLEAEKIGSKDGNPTYKILIEMEEFFSGLN